MGRAHAATCPEFLRTDQILLDKQESWRVHAKLHHTHVNFIHTMAVKEVFEIDICKEAVVFFMRCVAVAQSFTAIELQHASPDCICSNVRSISLADLGLYK